MTAVVQMGHVPRTSGATGAPGEQAYARGVAARVEALLGRDQIPVRIIFADPTTEAQYRGDLFVAIHYDASSSPSARGGSVGYATSEGARLAARWKRDYQRRGFGGGFRADNYTAGLSGYYGNRAAIRQGNRAAAILEGGFGTHTTEGPWLRSTVGMDINAWAIRDTILEELGRSGGSTPTGDDLMLERFSSWARPAGAKALRLFPKMFTDSTHPSRPMTFEELVVRLDREELLDALAFLRDQQADLRRLDPPTNHRALRTLIERARRLGG